jgi:hypothetical protein
MAPLLFHKDVFIPDFAQAPIFEGKLTYSRHAQNVTLGDGTRTDIPLPPVFVAKDATLVESEINPMTGAVEKQVWRQHLDAENDLCFAMLPTGFIKTCWVNAKRDTHKTLQKAKYVGGFQWRSMKNKLGAAKR